MSRSNSSASSLGGGGGPSPTAQAAAVGAPGLLGSQSATDEQQQAQAGAEQQQQRAVAVVQGRRAVNIEILMKRVGAPADVATAILSLDSDRLQVRTQPGRSEGGPPLGAPLGCVYGHLLHCASRAAHIAAC